MCASAVVLPQTAFEYVKADSTPPRLQVLVHTRSNAYNSTLREQLLPEMRLRCSSHMLRRWPVSEVFYSKRHSNMFMR